MKYFLSREAVLKWLEKPSVYHIKKDDIYELDTDSFEFLRKCSSGTGCNSDNSEFIDYCKKEGILTEDRIFLERPPLISSSFPSLRYLELQITDRCNLRCKHCYINTPLNPAGCELSVKQIRNILKEFEEMQGLRVLITGGEPLIHSRFDEINRILPDFFVRKLLLTNGLLLNKQILDSLNVDEIQISIDGLEKAHDALRGKGSFRSAMEAVRRSVGSGFDVSVSTMVHAKNLGDFEELDRIFKDLGVKDWTVDIPCPTGRMTENPEFCLEPEAGGKYLSYGYGEGLHAGEAGFACGLHLMSVMADGRVSKCTFYAEASVGTIENGLRENWQKIKPVRFEELRCDCEFGESCRGGCRYRAELSGDASGKDLYRCAFYDIIKKNNSPS
ncbi:MAG: radical SAM protein [Nitrospirota bacterium]